MYEFKRSIFINRTQQEVFDYTFDPANNAKWQSATESSAWTSEGSPGVGATFRIVAKQLGQRREVEMEVTRWEPPNGVGFKSLGTPPFEISYTLEAQGNGTLMVQKGKAELSGVFDQDEEEVARGFDKQSDANLETLKRLLEGGGD